MIIWTKDIMRIMDCNYKKAYNTYRYVKDVLGKNKKQLLTAEEFSKVMDLKLDYIYDKLKPF